ncbi:MAG: hypothetical protein ACRDTH_14595 [Pseudonocardiaceae bacterium]
MPAHEVLAKIYVICHIDVDQQSCDIHSRVEAHLTDGTLDRTCDCAGRRFAAADHCRLRVMSRSVG